MPLVVPGVQTEASSADKTEEFTMKLAGKKIDEIDKDKVRAFLLRNKIIPVTSV